MSESSTSDTSIESNGNDLNEIKLENKKEEELEKAKVKLGFYDILGGLFIFVIFVMFVLFLLIIGVFLIINTITDSNSCKNYRFEPGEYYVQSIINGTTETEKVLVTVAENIIFSIRNNIMIKIIRSSS
jgi:hypothetical protein